MPALEWRDAPTGPGWWLGWLSDDDPLPFLAEVYIDKHFPDRLSVRWSRQAGEDTERDLAALIGVFKWFGPIPSPDAILKADAALAWLCDHSSLTLKAQGRIRAALAGLRNEVPDAR